MMKLDVVHWLQPNVDSEVPELRYQQQGVDDEQNAHQPFTQSALDMHSVALSTIAPYSLLHSSYFSMFVSKSGRINPFTKPRPF